MAGYDPARPRHTLRLDGVDYELVGTFGLVEAVEHALQDGIIQVATRVVDMGLSDTAKLIAAMLQANGHRTTHREVGETLFDRVGVDSREFALLKVELYSFLRILLKKPSDREEAARSMGEMLGKPSDPPASPGETTGGSA